MFKKDSELIVVTGAMGSGKHEVADKLKTQYGLEVIDFNTIFEELSNSYGYIGYDEKKLVKKAAEEVFKLKILNYGRSGKSVILVHSFTKKWQKFLNYICKGYDYELKVVDCVSKKFDEIIETFIEKYDDTCFTAECYLNDETLECTLNTKKELKRLRKAKYNSIVGVNNYTDTDIK